MGLIKIENMEFYAFHGHYKEEQIVGNRFLVDLEMECDMALPAQSDQLDDAVTPAQGRVALALPERPTLAVLPGSRSGEVKHLMAPFAAAAAHCSGS